MGRELGRFVEERRKALGLTRKDLVARSGLSYPYVSQIETGDREPALKAMHALAQATDVTVEFLASLTSEEYSSSPSSRTPSRPESLPMSLSPSLRGPGEMREKVLASVERKLRILPPLERMGVLNELLAQAVAELTAEEERG